MVDDLKWLIFPHLLVLEENGQPCGEQTDLKNLAVTCRGFLEVALDVLWRQARFDRLMQVWKARGVVDERYVGDDSWRTIYPPLRTMEFATTPTIEDWQRFEYYARRIRRMQLEYLPASTNFWSAFASAVLNRAIHPTVQIEESPIPPIFPKIKSLECDLREDNFDACVRVINESPSLDSFALFADPGHVLELPSEPWVAVFSSLGNHGRPLKNLAIRPRMYGTEARDAMDAKTDSLAQLIRQSELEEVILPGDAIRVEIIASAMSYIPTLKLLEVWNHWNGPDEPDAVPIPHDAFPSLECLRGDIIAVASLLVIPTFPSLAKLMIQGEVGGAWMAWPFVREMIGTIAQSCPALEVLHLSVNLCFRETNDSESARRTTTSGFSTLQGCPRLKDVLLDFPKTLSPNARSIEDGINLSDAQWEQLAEAWPDLTSVRLCMGRCEDDREFEPICPRPRATLRTISSFLRHCPKLFSFGVPILARGEEARTALEGVSPTQGPTRLDFRGSWIDKEDTQDVALFIASQSPHQETEIRIPQPEEPYEPRLHVGGQTIEVAQYEGWQEIKHLVESARTKTQARRL
ncbi:hypothetical protein FRC01_007564 [Tulasnella sp. 417]|nr:hypothetical protein FRC01_007564 [Tulasnella sp. 417]